MLRRVGAKGLSMVAHRLALPLIVVATVFLVVIPLVDERTIYLSESNLKPRASTALRDDDFPTAYEGQATSSILGGREGGIASTTVRAERSPGGLVTCVLVNLDAQLSMMIAAALYRAFERERAGILTGDLRFLFFSWHAPSGSNQSFDVVADSIPASEVDVVFVLDVYQVTTTEAPQVISGNKNSPLLNLIASGPQSVCINVMGSNSIQPNLDIVNLAVMFGNQMKLKFDVSCQAPSSVSSGLPAQSDFADLIVTVIPTVDDKTAMRWGQYMRTLATVATVGATPQYGGRRIRARGMHGLVLHSPEPVLALPNSSSTSRAKELMPLAATLEGTIRAVNNLDERLHHSFPVYVHTSSEKFVDFEVLQFVVFIVLGAIGSSLYASYRQRAELRPSCDIEWLLLVGPDVAREVVFMLLTLSAIAWDELDSTTSTPSPTALVLVLTSRWLWTLASKKKVRPVPGVDYQKFAKDERMCQVEASSLVMGLWASVTVCLLLAYNPLLSLPGSVLMGWQSVVSAYSVRIMQDSRRALIAKASCALWLLFQTTITCFVAQWIIQHRTDKDGANTQFALYGLGTSVVWLVQQCIVALWS